MRSPGTPAACSTVAVGWFATTKASLGARCHAAFTEMESVTTVTRRNGFSEWSRNSSLMTGA